MDDSGSPHDFDAWQAVAASGTLLKQVEAEKNRTPAVLERWRAAFGAESVRIAVKIAKPILFQFVIRHGVKLI